MEIKENMKYKKTLKNISTCRNYRKEIANNIV